MAFADPKFSNVESGQRRNLHPHVLTSPTKSLSCGHVGGTSNLTTYFSPSIAYPEVLLQSETLHMSNHSQIVPQRPELNAGLTIHHEGRLRSLEFLHI